MAVFQVIPVKMFALKVLKEGRAFLNCVFPMYWQFKNWDILLILNLLGFFAL